MAVRFDPEVQAWVESEAKRRGRSISYIVRDLVKRGLPHIRKLQQQDC